MINQFDLIKNITKFTAFLLILAGIAGTAIAMYLGITDPDWSFFLQNLQTVMFILFIVLSILLTVTGAIGFHGALKDNKCLLNIYWVLLIFWILLFAICGILALQLPNRLQNQGCKSQNIPRFIILNQIITNASNTICKKNCKCYITNSTIQTIKQNNQLNTYNYSNIDASLPTKVQKCVNWLPSQNDQVFQKLERFFQCSGWCTGSQGLFFKFTDINHGKPGKACFDALYNWFYNYGRFIYILCFMIAGLAIPLLLLMYYHIQNIKQQYKPK